MKPWLKFHNLFCSYLIAITAGLAVCTKAIAVKELAVEAPTVEAAVAEQIIVWNRTYDQPSMLQVLQLALDKTNDSAPYTLARSVDMEQGRVIQELKHSKRVDIAAYAPTPQREAMALTIRIPLSKGLLGYRVCLVRTGDEDRFKHVQTINDWNNNDFSMGQGTHWPDTPILESNGIRVVKSVRYKPLFHMLDKKRFDCFPRSVNEVLSELNRPENSMLRLENNLLFQYRLPTFFFVNKNKPLLARRIETGLTIAIKDGSFDELFYQHHLQTLENVNLKNRHVIVLKNSALSLQTQKIIQRTELWLDPLK